MIAHHQASNIYQSLSSHSLSSRSLSSHTMALTHCQFSMAWTKNPDPSLERGWEVNQYGRSTSIEKPKTQNNNTSSARKEGTTANLVKAVMKSFNWLVN